jgi:hypothetical protein
MSHQLRACVLALSLATALSACDWGGDGDKTAAVSAQPTTPTTQEPTIESSLKGLTVLPSRLAWTATTSLPDSEVETVWFLVDGDRWWGDSSPPYTFGPPGAYLPVTWVSAFPDRTGRRRRTHEFAIRVDAANGAKWKGEAVRARTPKATSLHPPGFGEYGRTYSRLSAANIANPPPPGQFHPARGYLVFIGPSIFVSSPNGKHSFAWEISGNRHRVRLGTPIFLAEASHADATLGFDGAGEVLCAPDGPPATYSWSSTRGRVVFSYNGQDEYAHNLELRALREPCKERRRLLEGVWEGTNPG